jgi:hypothetical protein
MLSVFKSNNEVNSQKKLILKKGNFCDKQAGRSTGPCRAGRACDWLVQGPTQRQKARPVESEVMDQ